MEEVSILIPPLKYICLESNHFVEFQERQT